MGAVLLFLFTAATSFVGSLQAGLVNMAVLARTIQAGKQEGRRVALGGAIPELLYAGVAFCSATLIDPLLHEHALLTRCLGAGFLIGLGAYFLFRFDPTIRIPDATVGKGGFWMGLMLGSLNPQLILFWCGVIFALAASGRQPDGPADLIALSTGAFSGALALLLLLVALGDNIQRRATPEVLRMIFRAMGLILVVAGVILLLR